MRRKLIYLLVSFLVFFSLTVSVYHLAYYQKIYPHLLVGSIDVSNLTLNQAELKLIKFIPINPPIIQLKFGNQVSTLELADLQIKYDARRTAEKAFLSGRSSGFFKDFKLKWRLWWQPQNLNMEVDFNQQKLFELLEVVSQSIEEQPIIPSLTLLPDGKINLVPGRNGRLMDKNLLAQTVMNQISALNFNEIEMPILLAKIEITAEEMMTIQEQAQQIKDKKLLLKFADFSQTLSGQALIDLIGFNREEKLEELLTNLSQTLNREPQNAVFQFADGRVREFKPALPGIKVNEAETRQKILQGLADWQPIEISVIKAEPSITTESVNNLGIKELIGKGESFFYHSIAGRVHNIVLTAAKLNGVLIAPGDTFSFNQTVGDISRATGYQAAYIIQNGRTILGDGGGVCQDSTTLFRAVLNAGLDIVERRAHAYRVSYYENNSPPGFDATVFAPAPDFKFKNDTPAHILIQTAVDTEKLYLKIELYGSDDGRQINISNIKLWGQAAPPAPLYQDDPTLPAGTIKQVDWAAWGAKASFDWLVTRNGEILQQKTFYSNYQPWQAVYLRGTGGV